jgi:oligopeptide/dipeptide ABC transporter ATP-binding protein
MRLLAGYMSDKVVLEARNLKVYFPVTRGVLRRQIGEVKAVDDISFKLREKQVLGIVGESGCGKSTAARAAIRLMEPTSGDIYFNGQSMLGMRGEELTQLRKKIQIVFQDPYSSLNPRKTIMDNLGDPVLFHQMTSKADLRDYLISIMEKIGLDADALDLFPHQFSGGQQQRICLGRAIALKPELIVCDEAVSALDVSIQAQILNLLSDLKEEYNLTILFISHDLSVIRYFCDDVLVMYLGKVMEYGSCEDLFKSPRNPYTQALLESIPRSDPFDAEKRYILKGEVPSPRNPPSGCRFRTRCPYAREACEGEIPCREWGEGQIDYCVLPKGQ